MDINQSIRSYDNSIQKSKQIYSGILGLAIDGAKKVNIETRAGYVYVRLRDNLSEVIQAYNDKVSPVYDFPVLLERKGNKWYITGRDDARYETFGTTSPFLPQHGDSHSFNRDSGGGGDTVWVYPDQFIPLLVYPSGSFGASNLMIAPYVLQRDSDFIYVGNTGTGNLLVYKPTDSQAIVGLVYINRNTGNPGVLIASGTPMAGTITGTSSILPYLPYPSSNQEPLYAFRLVSGTSSINWNNLYNVRQFYGGGSVSTGSSGGGISGVVVQDEGVVQGTGTVFNFVGSNVSVTVSGSVARVYVTGSSGGGVASFITGSIPFAGSDGVLKEDNTLLWWDETYRGLRIGRSSRFNFADTFPIGVTARNADETISMGIYAYGTGSSGAPQAQWLGYRSRGTPASPLPVKSGDIFASLFGRGYDGGSFAAQSRINFFATGDMVTGTYAPTGIDFQVIPSGSNSIRSQLTIYGNSVNQPTGSTYNIGGVPHTHSASQIVSGNLDNARLGGTHFLYGFASYINISPLTGTNSYPFSATLPSFETYPQSYSQAVFIAAGTNNSSNYWTVELRDYGTNTLIASVSTQGLAANAGYLLTDTSMGISSLTQGTHRYIYVIAVKTGSPANLFVHCPSVEYTLS